MNKSNQKKKSEDFAKHNTNGKEKSDQERYLDMISLIEDNENISNNLHFFL